jgi:hypothetical protein
MRIVLGHQGEWDVKLRHQLPGFHM